MTNKTKDKGANMISVLEKTLKLILSLLKKIKYYVGIFLIDNLMRNIVDWYDERHAKPLTDHDYRETSRKLKNYLPEEAARRLEYEKLEAKLELLNSENEDLRRQIRDQKDVIDEVNQSHDSLQQIIAKLENKYDLLRTESDKLRKRCLPESEVPSMIYFAQGDASGLWLRKVSAVMLTDHLYILTTKPGDVTVCTFHPIIHHNVSDVIANRSITLIACDVISITPAASSLEVMEKGIAVLENNRWKVIRKAKIKLI